MKLSVTTNHNRRVQIPTSRYATMDGSQEVEVAVDVLAPRYVPNGVTVRARVNDMLFTATTYVDNLAVLENDPRVKSVQVGRPLHVPGTLSEG